MSKIMLTKDELKEKVSKRLNELIEKYSFSAERGVASIEKEFALLEVKADNTEIDPEERMLDILMSSAVLTCYAYELENHEKQTDKG